MRFGSAVSFVDFADYWDGPVGTSSSDMEVEISFGVTSPTRIGT